MVLVTFNGLFINSSRILGLESSLLIDLGYALADAGFDVWMGNARGNVYSRAHTTYNPDGKRRERKKFWTFSWNEIGNFEDLIFRVKDLIREKNHFISAIINFRSRRCTNNDRLHFG